ncbi:MAG: sigma-70 family RNA polymerase sigma factor, partial [Gemmataceae bacterium]|nr:sigma-70 family RNA polymerase sigma factor [Gemmataceae bacterium]
MEQVVHELRRTAMLPDGAGASDGHLLERFIADRDAVAFEALVRRHGAMVLGVCRRVTGHVHDAEDAFQAAFLVLARKAAAVRPRELLGNWLYGVAWRSALEARTKAARRTAREQPLHDMLDPHPRSTDRREACALLDQELSKLPDKYRSAIVLCELQGRPRQEVADRLGIPAGTLSSRLAYARKLLAQRLSRRGVALSAAGLATLGSATMASAELAATTVATCMRLAAGQTLAEAGVSTGVVNITEGVMKAMLLGKLKKSALLAAAALCLAGIGVWGAAVASGQNADPPADKATRPSVSRPSKPQPRPEPPAEGRLMVFRDGALASVTPDGKDIGWLVTKEDKVPLHPFSNSSLSPDGKRLALLVIDLKAIEAARASRGTHKAIAYVHVRDANGQGSGENLGVSGTLCHWSNDSAKLLVSDLDVMELSRQGSKVSEVVSQAWIIDVKTKKKTAVNVPNNHLVIDWSRDGQWLLALAFEKTEKKSGSKLVMLKKDGSAKYDVTSPDQSPSLGKLSPDGK